MATILDCYTDEPAGLGVPPFLGTYPRYIAGSLEEIPYYLTIDDLRLFRQLSVEGGGVRSSAAAERVGKVVKPSKKTNIKIYNLTKNFKNIQNILNNTKQLIIIAGVHTPGKYL